MTIRADNFLGHLAELRRKVSDLVIADAIWNAMYQVGIDADTIPPTTPLKDGNLRASKKVRKPDIKKSSITGSIAFEAAYAHRWHETKEAIKWSEPGSGAQYLATKLARQFKKYMEIVYEHVKRSMK